VAGKGPSRRLRPAVPAEFGPAAEIRTMGRPHRRHTAAPKRLTSLDTGLDF